MTTTKQLLRYADLYRRARELNHTLCLVVAGGTPRDGDTLTYVELSPPDDDDLDAALAKVAEYLDGPDAARRGELYARREAARRDRAAVLAQMIEVTAASSAIEDEIEADTRGIIEARLGSLRHALDVDADEEGDEIDDPEASTFAPTRAQTRTEETRSGR